MKFTEINKRYTEIVTEYIAKGYTIHTGTMKGSEGEIAHIDFTDGENVIRVLLKKTYIYGFCTKAVYQIIVGKCTDNVDINKEDSWNTVWNSRLEVIQCEEFYVLGEDRNAGTEFGTKEEAEEADKKRMERCKARSKAKNEAKRDITEKAFEIGKCIVKRVFNKKKVSNEDIKVVRQFDSYYIWYKTQCYRLH